MDNITDSFADILKTLPAGIVAVMIMSTIIFYIFKDGITNWLKREVKQVKKIKKLEHHRFFNVCDDVEAKISKMKFITHNEFDATKTKIMHELIKLKCESMRKIFKDLLNKSGIDNWDAYKLNYEFKSALTEVVKEYNDKCKMELIRWGISERDAIYIIQEYEDYRMTMVEGFLDSIDSVISNPDYQSNFDKTNTTLELCSLAIAVIPRDVRSVFESVNGRYKHYNI